ncbi:SDR family oxidoreductase [Lentzea sp. NPDC059081]|uniref:SDR family oxidoreductase n=1 Tax=Lentzea sp. NPDC059081 TaxID=3346719 RepID=UPI0036916E80
MNSSGNTIFVAGSTSGIGLGMALRWAQRGNEVIVGGRREDQLAAIKRDHPEIDTVVIDVTDARSITEVTAKVVGDHPDLDMLVTMAGIMRVEDLRTPEFLPTSEAVIDTNVHGTVRLIAALTPHLMTRPKATIMTVSSGFGFVPWHVTPTYNATKAFVHSYTQSLRVQLSDTDVNVVELIPPAVRTPLLGQEDNLAFPSVEEYLDEVFALIDAQPEAHEIAVEGVRFYRDAEREGRYADVFAANVAFAV